MPKKYNDQPNQIIDSWNNKRQTSTRLYFPRYLSRQSHVPTTTSVGGGSAGGIKPRFGASSFVGSLSTPGVY